MSLQNRIRTLSFESLHQLITQAHQEINRRQAVIERIPPLKLGEIAFSVRARDLLYRTIAEKKKLAYGKDASTMTLGETLQLLEPDDWRQIKYKNSKVFDEIQAHFQTHKAPLEWYYNEVEQRT